ncbi:MAG: M20/M25/M40 family metallo-hydrolase [Acutalibacteraceae bacterium]|nr:M20/M25/M40 family metallo-hydrolase [Acutalibacteraceae bacterium]
MKKSKIIKTGLGVAALAGVGVSMVRAATTYKAKPIENANIGEEEKVDVERFIKNLSDAIKIPTIANRDESLVDWAPFDEFHEMLEKAYPIMHEKLEKEIISTRSLLYHWKSEHPEKEPIALLSHQDVVPVTPGTEDDWKYPAYSGEIAEGFLWGRGAIDMKNHLIGVCEAVETLLEEGYVPERDVYLCFGHNEEVMAEGEICGADCMMRWFKERGIKLDSVLDEGGAILEAKVDKVIDGHLAGVGIAEKGHVDFEISVNAKGGHSSQPPKHSALGELSRIVCKLENNQFKAELTPQLYSLFNEIGKNTTYPVRCVMSNLPILKPLVTKICSEIPPVASMMRTTTAVTMANGSPAPNVLPQKATVNVNFRIMPGQTIDDVEAHIRKIAGPKAEVKMVSGKNPSKISPTDSRAFNAIREICKEMDPKAIVAPYLVMGGTDARNYEDVCDNIYRYSPFLMDTALLLTCHGTNERIPLTSLKDGVVFFKKYIRELTKD